MSREFGDNRGELFHEKIYACIQDLKDSREEFHQKFIPLFEELHEIAYAISSVEASDSSLDRSVLQSIETLPKIMQIVRKLDDELDIYRNIMELAVRNATKKNDK